jgi:hypothetical protein
MSKKLLALAALALLPLSVQAADVPKEGTDSYSNVWVQVSSSDVKLGGDRSLGVYEIVGSAIGGTLFNNMAMRCVGLYEEAGVPDDTGACTYTDKDGDQIFQRHTQHSKSEPGHLTFVGGTGKFAGFSGTGEYSIPSVLKPKGDKYLRGIVAHKVEWKIQ